MEYSLDDFPYYLCEKPKHHLVASYFLHLNRKVQYSMPQHQGTENRVLLSGLEGTDVYHDALAIALSRHFGVKLIVLDCQTNLDVLTTFCRQHPNDALRFHTALPPFYENSQSRAFKIGDRVIFTGLNYSTLHSNIASSGPSFGYRGKVVVMNITNGLGVRFDLPFYGGSDLGGLCEAYRGFYCDGNEVCLDVDDEIKPTSSPIQGFCAENRLIVFMKHMENCLREDLGGFNGMSDMVSTLPDNVFVIGSHIQKDCTKQKGNLNGTEEEDRKFLMQQLSRVFPEKISVEIPEDKKLLDQMKRQMIRDDQLLKARENVARLKRVLFARELESEFIETIHLTGLELTNEDADKVVKWALGCQLMAHRKYYSNSKLVISQECIVHGLNNLRAVQTDNARVDQVVIRGSQGQGIPICDAFEKRILEDTILHSNIGIKFGDIGALENIKDSLKEVVVLPIKRPKLIHKGQLRKLCRGVLLFGPPGTGKTMLAKAVAAEAGANLFNISASIIASKWSADSQHFVKALSSLASKMAPSILFIDEADSLFGQRNPGPYTMCKIKNDFMLYWDRLHFKDEEKIIVLAATNRPFDLDETFIRRVPRRLLVNLPDSPSRSKILKVILEMEDLTEDVNFNAIAQITNGFSGNDLKNLCIAAAHRPIREIILKDKLKSSVAEEEEEDAEIRPLNMKDFKDGFQQVKRAPSNGLNGMLDILHWNGLYGGADNSGGVPSASYYI